MLVNLYQKTRRQTMQWRVTSLIDKSASVRILGYGGWRPPAFMGRNAVRPAAPLDARLGIDGCTSARCVAGGITRFTPGKEHVPQMNVLRLLARLDVQDSGVAEFLYIDKRLRGII